MTDSIEIVGLRVLGVHGALESEQEQAQPFELDLFVGVDLAPAGESDALDATVDYGMIVARAVGVVGQEHHQLLESLAASLARTVLSSDERIESITVAVRKLRPPLPSDVRSTGVRITRTRQDLASGR